MGLLDRVLGKSGNKDSADDAAQPAEYDGANAGAVVDMSGIDSPPDGAHIKGAGAASVLTADTPHDESEPGFEPIAGVGLEKYAELAVGMQGMPESEFAAYAEANGVAPGRWDEVRSGWNARFESVPAVTIRWGQLYRQKLASAGVTRPDVSFEQYVTATAKRNIGRPLEEIYADLNLTVSTWALVSDYWVAQLAADPQLTVKFQNDVKAEMATLGGS